MESTKQGAHQKSKLSPDVKPFVPRQSFDEQQPFQNAVPKLQHQGRYPNSTYDPSVASVRPKPMPESSQWRTQKPRKVGTTTCGNDWYRQTNQSEECHGKTERRDWQPVLRAKRYMRVDFNLSSTNPTEPLNFNVQSSGKKHDWKNGEKRTGNVIQSDTSNARNVFVSEIHPKGASRYPYRKPSDFPNRQNTFPKVLQECNSAQYERKREAYKTVSHVIDKNINDEWHKCASLMTRCSDGTTARFPNSKDMTNSGRCHESMSDTARVSGYGAKAKQPSAKYDCRRNVAVDVGSVKPINEGLHSKCQLKLESPLSDRVDTDAIRMKTKYEKDGPRWSMRKMVHPHQNRSGSAKNVNVKIGDLNYCNGTKMDNDMEIVKPVVSLESNCLTENCHQDKENGGMQSKKKKKTDSQRKKEYRNKLKSLPSVQGKILTVTHEFYNLVQEKNTAAVSTVPNRIEDESAPLLLDDFPALGEDVKSGLCLDTSYRTLDSGAQSDSDWSDIDDGRWQSEKVVATYGDFPALGVLVVQPKSRTVTYSELLKKSTRSGDLFCSSASGKRVKSLLAPHEPNFDDRDSTYGPATGHSQSNSVLNVTTEVTHNRASRKPKANSLIQLDLVNMLAKKQKNKEKVRVVSRDVRKVMKTRPVIANILDSSAPTRRRGKEREKPPKKKSTPLKKIILQEREEKKIKKLEDLALPTGSNDSIVSDRKAANAVCNCDVSDLDQGVSSSLTPVASAAKAIIHNRKFRDYCNQVLNPEIDEVVTKLIQDLIRFHDRLYQKDPVKAKMRRRMVVGLREVTKHLKLKKIKCLILAPNLEKIKSDGGLDAVVNNILALAQEQNVPFVFALGRKSLGYVCLKKVPVSCVGIFDYDGSEANFKRLCELAVLAKEAYCRAFNLAVLKVSYVAESSRDTDIVDLGESLLSWQQIKQVGWCWLRMSGQHFWEILASMTFKPPLCVFVDRKDMN